MTNNFDLYGTDQPPVVRRDFSIAGLAFSYEEGALRHIKLDGVEAIRGIAFLVRDRDWGTLVPQITAETVEQTEFTLRITYNASYENQGARLDVNMSILASADGLTMAATGRAFGAFETNRAGFTVLHPITGVSGRPVHVAHSDGSSENAYFPDLIEPWQPFMDITALTHQAGGNSVTCQFSGDTFEMEDQRQWGDASYKTYNRPLAKVWPYEIEDGAALEQSVALTWKACDAPTSTKVDAPMGEAVFFPQTALVITPEDALRLADNPADLKQVNPQRLLCHLDAALGDTAGQISAFAIAQKMCPDVEFDLELICLCEADPEPELMELAAQISASGFAPASVLVCPSVDRQSTPPGSEWPACPPLDVIHRIAAKAFPNTILGGGMVSFFPELNRKRPPQNKSEGDMLAFISHGLCPIVHAADDISVMETLETIPHITKSAQAIIGERSYRIGPATIAMRQNPYGDRTIPNPDNRRVCMADNDPRHRAKFGAAYAIGLATALAKSEIAIWTPAALYGPRGVVADNGTLDHQNWPLVDAIKQLSALAEQPVHSADISAGVARLIVGDTELSANLTAQTTDQFSPYQWRMTQKSV